MDCSITIEINVNILEIYDNDGNKINESEWIKYINEMHVMYENITQQDINWNG